METKEVSMEKEKATNLNFIETGNCSIRGNIIIPRIKSYSIIAMNIETLDDVQAVIHQCKLVESRLLDELKNTTDNENPDV